MPREIRLLTTPTGLPRPEDFEIAEAPVPAPAEGEVLLRNRFFHVFAALRSLLAGGVKGAPFPPVRPGDALFGPAIGEVVSAPDGSGLRPGELVFHWLGWREYAVSPVGQCVPLGDTLPDPVAHLSQGLTAYAALAGNVSPGDTVFVSGGAGAVGTMAGQVARLLGAGRVVGSTGSPEKGERLVAELGYDAAVIRGADSLDRQAAPISEQLGKAAPDGIDVFVDTVGGEQLQAALAAARPGARFVLAGALSGQMAANASGTTAEVELDVYQLILKGVVMRGLRIPDGLRTEWLDRFGGWLRTGEIVFPHVRVPGIENAARALQEVIGGRHLGTVVVEL
ncbi:MDR family NADP-dependent oxidoreductase [Nonomuraea rhizosphaerae]|uniref:MDR family NADP-dependent oxidoreductase n=1 Tax=Nonomuraea rhizosphaerae TaxID=2665663 RepID=UPI001C607BAD|nr:NADP-dependent oxidoreductase [Nonomuraea rhizosphaerae]